MRHSVHLPTPQTQALLQIWQSVAYRIWCYIDSHFRELNTGRHTLSANNKQHDSGLPWLSSAPAFHFYLPLLLTVRAHYGCGHHIGARCEYRFWTRLQAHALMLLWPSLVPRPVWRDIVWERDRCRWTSSNSAAHNFLPSQKQLLENNKHTIPFLSCNYHPSQHTIKNTMHCVPCTRAPCTCAPVLDSCPHAWSDSEPCPESGSLLSGCYRTVMWQLGGWACS